MPITVFRPSELPGGRPGERARGKRPSARRGHIPRTLGERSKWLKGCHSEMSGRHPQPLRDTWATSTPLPWVSLGHTETRHPVRLSLHREGKPESHVLPATPRVPEPRGRCKDGMRGTGWSG